MKEHGFARNGLQWRESVRQAAFPCALRRADTPGRTGVVSDR
jgi:hypothetical protein